MCVKFCCVYYVAGYVPKFGQMTVETEAEKLPLIEDQ
jgi:hypothetical protein